MANFNATAPTTDTAKEMQERPRHLQPYLHILSKQVTMAPHIVWLLTKNDFYTFVCPNTIYGIFSALSGSIMIDNPNTMVQILLRLPWVILFNWSNVLIFDMANQRLPSSVEEDRINKPWRAVPSGRMTSNQVRKGMLVAIPAVLAFNHFVLHVGVESALLLVGDWLYNDLGGGDENWVLRNTILAAAFWLYNVGSTKVAARTSASPHCSLNAVGLIWTSVVSLVILTTIHVQDLKDQNGDRVKRRSTAPIVLGDHPSRWTIAVLVTFWSVFCAYYWKLGSLGLELVSLGIFVAWRCVSLREKCSDRRTWELWALWTTTLYTAPFWYSLRKSGLIVDVL
jgi:4-hydroxybenzoate polyprenyltransferase